MNKINLIKKKFVITRTTKNREKDMGITETSESEEDDLWRWRKSTQTSIWLLVMMECYQELRRN